MSRPSKLSESLSRPPDGESTVAGGRTKSTLNVPGPAVGNGRPKNGTGVDINIRSDLAESLRMPSSSFGGRSVTQPSFVDHAGYSPHRTPTGTPHSVGKHFESHKDVVRRHLLGTTAATSVPGHDISSSSPGGAGPPSDEEHYAGHGGDITGPIYRWATTEPEGPGGAPIRRSRSHTSLAGSMAETTRVREILAPGGFRREFVKNGTGRDVPSFGDVLAWYNRFGGEDLDDLDEVSDEDELPTERTRLVPKPTQGNTTVTQAVLMLLKSFVGTGVLFLGKAFANGGILFSTVVLSVIGLVSLWSFLLLLETRSVINGSFGDMGGILYGPQMRRSILGSLVLSQLGFVAAYTIFVTENLQAFFLAVSACRTVFSTGKIIAAQVICFLPLALIRNIHKLSGTALIADAFILLGLVYIFSSELGVIAERGISPIRLFNPRDFPLLIGTAVFSFEGIGLILPISESMQDPSRFPAVLSFVMIGVLILFAGAGALAYMAYGVDVNPVVFLNLPQDNAMTNITQLLYSIAILLSTPLQLFPAVRIMENALFVRSGKHSRRVKWHKNTFRALTVVFCGGLAYFGSADLDKFVSLIGSVACVPLCFCYPAMLHYRACAKTSRQRAADIALFVFGILAAAYTTTQTIRLILAGGGAPAPPGQCPPTEMF